MLESSEKELKEIMIKTLLWIIINILETNLEIESFSKGTKSLNKERRYREESNGNFIWKIPHTKLKRNLSGAGRGRNQSAGRTTEIAYPKQKRENELKRAEPEKPMRP